MNPRLVSIAALLVMSSGCASNPPAAPEPDTPGLADQPAPTLEPAPWTQSTRLAAFDPASEDLFGDDVAATTDTIVVGSELKHAFHGVADVFIAFSGEWRFSARLSGGAARHPEQGFGSAVGVGGGFAFVGAHRYAAEDSADNQRGAVYVFQNSGAAWHQRQVLVAPDADDFAFFGSTLALEIDQRRLAVGAPGHERGQGAVYVFRLAGGTWELETTLAAQNGRPFEDFGAALAIAGSTLVVGAPLQDAGTGAAYLFERNTDWTATQKLTAPDATRGVLFGGAIAVDGDWLAVAAASHRAAPDQPAQTGAVYLFERMAEGWAWRQTLLPSATAAGLFGTALAFDDGILAVGSEARSVVVLYEQAAGAWTAIGDVRPNDAAGDPASFGNALAFNRGTLVIGARSATVSESRAAGAVYVFDPSPPAR